MKKYDDLDDFIKDLTEALGKQDNNFSRKILEFLADGPDRLVKEFREHPNARLVAHDGNWLSLWSGGVRINGKLFSYKQIVEKIRDLQPSTNEILRNGDVR